MKSRYGVRATSGRKCPRPTWVVILTVLVLLLASIVDTAAAAGKGGTKALLAAFRRASGGSQWSSVRSLHFVTMVKSGGMTGLKDRWEDVWTGRYVERIRWPNFATLDGFDGVTSWRQGRSEIPYTLGDRDAALVAADESFRVARGWWFPDRHPATIALAGLRLLNGRPVDAMEITPEGGRQFEASVDKATHLLARIDEQQAEDQVVTTFGDYRLVARVMLPFSVRSSDGLDPAFDDLETVKAVEVNPNVPDSFFSIPPRPPEDIELPAHHDSVEVPFELTAGDRILVPLTVDGHRTLKAEFDSGGSLILQPATLTKLGIAATGKFKQGGNFEGATTAQTGRLENVALGDAIVRNVAFHSYGFAPGQPDKALVGLEILQRFVVRLDFDRHIMTLTRPLAFDDHGLGTAIPFWFQDNQPEIKGSIDGIAAFLTIDTGEAASLDILAPFARRYDLLNRYQANISDEPATGPVREVWARRRAGSVALDGPDGRPLAEVHQPVIRISLERSGFGADRDVSANIGLGILRKFNLTFDYPRQRIFLEPNRLHAQKDVFNRVGLRLRPRGAAWVVNAAYPGSPAADAGIRPGDIVLAVDGKTADILSSEQIWSKFKAPVGTKLMLKVSSPAGERSIVLSLRDIL